MFLSEIAWISFGALPCRKRNLMTARISICFSKSRASLTCFHPGQAKDLSAPQYVQALVSKNVPLWDNVEKYGRTRQTTDDNMAQALCLLITKATDSYNLSYNYRFFIAIMISRTRLNAALHVNCLYFFSKTILVEESEPGALILQFKSAFLPHAW